MFDSTFGLDKDYEQDSKLSATAFAQRYYNLISARQRLRREAHLVHMLEDVVERCDPDEIDSVFSL